MTILRTSAVAAVFCLSGAHSAWATDQNVSARGEQDSCYHAHGLPAYRGAAGEFRRPPRYVPRNAPLPCHSTRSRPMMPPRMHAPERLPMPDRPAAPRPMPWPEPMYAPEPMPMPAYRAMPQPVQPPAQTGGQPCAEAAQPAQKPAAVSRAVADSDHDGVPDDKDICPQTPAGVKVGNLGCEPDSDNDDVADARDQCPGTPAGVKVNETGCQPDSDNDGVADAKDQCPDTPAGVKVNETGCQPDSDNDGVADARDQCPDTPAGVKVNANGCVADSDHDGVPDSKDLCPNTRPGDKVGELGCKMTTPIVLEGVHFETDSNKLTADSTQILDKVAQSLVANPGIKVEIAGHTDSDGTADYNLALSQLRAQAVVNYLIGKGVAAENLVARGYGETRPVADNNTAAGKAQNRRVELKRLQ